MVDGGEEGGVGADQGRVLEREQRAIGLAALLDPLVGQVHRRDPVFGGRADRFLGLAVEVAVKPDQRLDQLVRGGTGLCWISRCTRHHSTSSSAALAGLDGSP